MEDLYREGKIQDEIYLKKGILLEAWKSFRSGRTV